MKTKLFIWRWKFTICCLYDVTWVSETKSCNVYWFKVMIVTDCTLIKNNWCMLCWLARPAARFEQNWTDNFLHSVRLSAVREWQSCWYGGVGHGERERERQSGGNVNCWLVKVQGLRMSDILWAFWVVWGQDGGCNDCDGLLELTVWGQDGGWMVVMVCWS